MLLMWATFYNQVNGPVELLPEVITLMGVFRLAFLVRFLSKPALHGRKDYVMFCMHANDTPSIGRHETCLFIKFVMKNHFDKMYRSWDNVCVKRSIQHAKAQLSQ